MQEEEVLISSSSASFTSSSSKTYEEDELEEDQKDKQLFKDDLLTQNHAVEQEIRAIFTTTTNNATEKYDDDSFEIEEKENVDKIPHHQEEKEENIDLSLDPFESYDDEEEKELKNNPKRSLEEPVEHTSSYKDEEDAARYEDEEFESLENSTDTKKENKPSKQLVHTWVQQKIHQLHQQNKTSPSITIESTQLFSANQISLIRQSLKRHHPPRRQRIHTYPQKNTCKVPNDLINRAKVQRLLSMGIYHDHVMFPQALKQVSVPKRSLSTFCSVKKEHLEGILATIHLENTPPPELKTFELMVEMIQAQRKIHEPFLCENNVTPTSTMEITRIKSLLQLKDSRLLIEKANQELCYKQRNCSACK